MLILENTFANSALMADEGYQAPHRFLILGLGESGVAMAKWCLRNGAQVRLADTRDQSNFSERQNAWLEELKIAGLKDICFGPLGDELLKNIDVIGISPGLSPLQEPTKSFLAKADQAEIDVWSEIEFFARAIAAMGRMAKEQDSTQEQASGYSTAVLAITGTNGKTTTTALTGQLCERAGKKVAVAGNISPAALDKLMSCLDAADQIVDMPDIWVLELSSFQLVYTHTLNATAATVLNLTQDHLDWHGDMQAYAEAKSRIFGDDTVCILNRDDALVMGLLSEELKAEKSVVTFGSNRPDEQGAFGIEHDLRAGGIDWLVWAEVDEDVEPKPKRRRKSAAIEEDEPLLHCGPEHLLQQFTPLGAEQYIHIEYPPNYLVKGSFGHLEQAWINFLSQLETNDEIWSFLIPKDSQTHYYSRGAEGNIRGFAQIRDKKIINEFIYESD